MVSILVLTSNVPKKWGDVSEAVQSNMLQERKIPEKILIVCTLSSQFENVSL